MSELRVGVVGLGSMGTRHAAAYSKLPGVKLQAVATRSEAKRQEAAAKWNVETSPHYEELVGRVDAVTVATPTYLHAEVAEYFLRSGVHVLVEKPIAATEAEATRLISVAKQADVRLMVGHLERFNPAFIRLTTEVMAGAAADVPWHVRGHRLGPYDGRIHDVCVVLDLMIHDFDLVTALHAGEKWELEQALGQSVVTPRLDVAMVQFQFFGEGHPPAKVHLLASRVNETRRRFLEVKAGSFTGRADLFGQRVWVARGSKEPTEVPVDKQSALELQLAHFVASVRTGTTPAVSGEMATESLKMSLAAIEMIGRNMR